MTKSSVITEEFNAIQVALEVLEPLNEAQRRFAVTMILSRLGVSASPASAGGTPNLLALGTGAAGFTPPLTLSPEDLKKMSPKDFLKLKKPRTDLERLVCLAYYLLHARDVQTFSTRDITKLNGEAGGTDFTNAATTAKNGVSQSKFLSKAGGGKKRLTTLGESVVEALPDAEKVKAAIAEGPKRHAKRKKRKVKS
jgi:hypothetical protein